LPSLWMAPARSFCQFERRDLDGQGMKWNKREKALMKL
jgi:hypothetical protein